MEILDKVVDSSLESSELAQESLKQALIELESIQAEQDRRLRDNGVYYYVPNPIQSKAHNSKARIVVYCGGNRPLEESTLVRMSDGKAKQLSDIVVGDNVLAYSPLTGRCFPTRVTKVLPLGFENCVKVTLDDSKEVICTPDHCFPVKNYFNNKIKRKAVKDINKLSHFVLSNEMDFEPVKTPFSGLLLGLYLGDGSSSVAPSNGYNSCNFTNIRLSILDLFKTEMVQSFPDLKVTTYPSDSTRLHITGKGKGKNWFLNSLRELGLDGKKSDEKFIPDIFKYSDKETRRDILRGLILTDGCTDKRKVCIYSNSLWMLKDCEEIITSLGGRSRIYHSHDGRGNQKDGFVLQFTLNMYEKMVLGDLLHKTPTLIKKHWNIKSHYKIRSIEDIGARKVRCIEIEHPDHYFVLANGIITSNSGKSTFGAAELSMHTVGWYPDWFPVHRRFNRAVKAVVLATEFPVVERVIEPKLRAYLPKDSVIKWKRSPQGYLQRLVIKSNWGGESVVDILTGEMDDMACESADWDFLWGDEPIQKSKFYAIQRGLIDRSGISVLTFTPLIQPWMKADLVDKSDGKKVECFISDIRDNKFDVNGKQILNEESIQAFEDMLPDEIKETRIHGKFFHLQGVVYKEFSDVHLRKFDYEQGLPVICVLDPHDRISHHVIWAFLDKTDDIKVFYEMAKHCTLKELAANILGIEEHFGFKMRSRLIDPNFGRKPVLSSGKSVIEELSLCGVHFAEANDNIEAGQLKVKDYLHYNRNKPLDINNAPKIFFHKENCPLTIKSLRELQFEEWVGKTKGEKDPKETVKQKDNHGSDCVRYLCMYNPTHSGSRSYQPVFNEPIY